MSKFRWICLVCLIGQLFIIYPSHHHFFQLINTFDNFPLFVCHIELFTHHIIYVWTQPNANFSTIHLSHPRQTQNYNLWHISPLFITELIQTWSWSVILLSNMFISFMNLLRCIDKIRVDEEPDFFLPRSPHPRSSDHFIVLTTSLYWQDQRHVWITFSLMNKISQAKKF
jgi:hypothetical protein